MLYSFLKNFVAIFFKPLYLISAKHADRQPTNGPYIICANHISILDAIFIAFFIKNDITFMGKVEIFSWPIIGSIVKKLKAVPINRDGNDVIALKTAIKVLKNKNIIMIFPQGKRCRGETVSVDQMKDGAVFMSYFSKAPILPVGIAAKNLWIKPFRRTRINFGEPITLDSIGEYSDKFDFFKKMTKKVTESIDSLIFEEMDINTGKLK